MSVTINDFGASGASHSSGVVPDPGSTAGTSRFLREDSSWATPGNSEQFFYDIGSSCAALTGAGTSVSYVQLSAGGQAILSVPGGNTVDGLVFHAILAGNSVTDPSDNYTAGFYFGTTSTHTLGTFFAPSNSVQSFYIDVECLWSSITQELCYTITGKGTDNNLTLNTPTVLSASSLADVQFSCGASSGSPSNTCTFNVTQFSIEI